MTSYPEAAQLLVHGPSIGEHGALLITDFEKLLPEIPPWRR